VNGHEAGILAWVLGDRSAATFWQLWLVLRCWGCFLYISDGYRVYQCFIDDLDHKREQSGDDPCGRREQSPTALSRSSADAQESRYRFAIARHSAIPSLRRCCAIQFACSCIISRLEPYRFLRNHPTSMQRRNIRYILFLCGYFDSGYLGYEAAEGIDWVWEHRIEDLAQFGM